jgi:hypothetical protein
VLAFYWLFVLVVFGVVAGLLGRFTSMSDTDSLLVGGACAVVLWWFPGWWIVKRGVG